MFLSGSCAFSFIVNPHDIDFVKLNEEEKTDYQQINYYKQKFNLNKVDVFIQNLSIVSNININNLLLIPVYDKNINKNSPLDIQIKQNSKLILTLMRDFITSSIKNLKILYRFELLFNYINNNFKAVYTEEEIKLINDLHDINIPLITLNQYKIERLTKITALLKSS